MGRSPSTALLGLPESSESGRLDLLAPVLELSLVETVAPEEGAEILLRKRCRLSNQSEFLLRRQIVGAHWTRSSSLSRGSLHFLPSLHFQDTRPHFLRGDCNDDGAVDISDAIFTLGSLFLGDGDPRCDDACDSNDDGAVDISDPIATLGVLFLGNGATPLPGMNECGVDPTADDVGCDTFERCP